ncbi:hypothetical protein [Erythrobacter sp. HI0074]|uniref:hypothetical protein n=1 Tax=Erythrobacter sp. HI0074 TaxID=1822249 RepID=UPI0007BA9CE9|nr:hypothetical protein [Erythrobacter sp. HI0074]KZY90844.1 hypothetical protein A3745_05425 [Erythrobacter sp. HI0074]KZZ07763.1 hypothetical protein A3748_13680 [Erythrobacter sp. HI0077]
MEKDLQDRLRAAHSDILGEVHGRPAVDWNERKGNERSAFPAIVLTTVSPGREYVQGGTDALKQPRIRAEIFDLTPLSVKAMKRAVIEELESTARQGATQFSRSRLAFERDTDPEDLPGGLKVFRTILDFFVPHSPA